MNFENFKQEMKSEQKTSMEYDGGMAMNYKDACPCAMSEPIMMPSANPCCMPNVGPACMPIYECPRENVCHRYICYEVPHIMPCNTRIVNHHIYRHTYRPEYTCCEENVYQDVYDNRPCC